MPFLNVAVYITNENTFLKENVRNFEKLEYHKYLIRCYIIVCFGVSAPSKTPPSLFHQALVKSANCLGPPF